MSQHVSEHIENILSSRGRIKVLKAIVNFGTLNLTRICKITGLHHRLVKTHLISLKRYGIISEDVIGKVKVYRINSSNPKAIKIARLIEVLEV